MEEKKSRLPAAGRSASSKKRGTWIEARGPVDGHTEGSDLAICRRTTATGTACWGDFVDPWDQAGHLLPREFLSGLVDRGLRYQAGLLCVIDGSIGLKAAIRQVLGHDAKTQRCQ